MRKLSKKRVGIAVFGVLLLFMAVYIMIWRLGLKLVDGGTITMQVGEELSQDVEDYLNLTWYLPFERENIISECQLTFSEIKYMDSENRCPQIGEYEGTITYHDESYFDSSFR